MREGSLEAPTRHPLPWREEAFYDEAQLDAETRRIFDICHGCRRCFNLCDSFPRLFDLIDESETGELDSVDSKDFKPVVDACTLCDMCFMTKCPYVPPHAFNLDFPHLMLRWRAVAARKAGGPGFAEAQLTKTDRNGRLAAMAPGLANWASDEKNRATRGALETIAGVHREARLPKFTGTPLTKRAAKTPAAPKADAPGAGRKAVLYATCTGEWNKPGIGEAALKVLALNGVETRVDYPGCCGMPQLESGAIGAVVDKAARVADAFAPMIAEGWDVIALVPSCALMMKFEWPLLDPENAALKTLAKATFDISEYVVGLAKGPGLAEGRAPLDGGVAVHIACHARAQNMGQKAAEMLRLIPETKITPIERCAGHGGSWGVMKENFEIGLKVGKPVFKQAVKSQAAYVVSECPLAADHILQGMERMEGEAAIPPRAWSPIELLAKSYGLID